MTFSDRYCRPLRSLRISVTDRCHLRCRYCMPEPDYSWVPHDKILTFEEICSLARIFVSVGVHKFRLTGGEPLLRHGLETLVRLLAKEPGVKELALTTNGVLLAGRASELAAAGITRVTVSFDTLRRDRMERLTGADVLSDVLAGIEAVRATNTLGLKLNAVLLRGFNDDELIDLTEFGKWTGSEIRFVEYMDVGGATRWSADQVFPRAEILDRLGQHYGSLRPLQDDSNGPAERFALPDGQVIGIIASVTKPFCDACDRSRLTADGHWYVCLYATEGLDLRAALRARMRATDIGELLKTAWGQRAARGAEERLGLIERGPFISRDALRCDNHLEMHTRGG